MLISNTQCFLELGLLHTEIYFRDQEKYQKGTMGKKLDFEVM